MVGHLNDAHDCVGTDLSTRQIDYARATYGAPGARFYATTPAQLPSDEARFDAATLVELIEHLHPALVDETIGAALDRLRPGGRLVVNAITLENAGETYQALRARGLCPEVTLLQIARAEPLAHYLRYEALNPIQIFAVTRPEAA